LIKESSIFVIVTIHIKMDLGMKGGFLERMAASASSRRQVVEVTEKSTSKTFTSETSLGTTLIFVNCVDCNFVIDGVLAKISIQKCTNCRFVVRGRVVTGTLEIMTSESINMIMESACPTTQVDDSQVVSFVFPDPALLGAIIFIRCKDLSVQTADVRDSFADPTVDATETPPQMMIRLAGGAFVCEPVCRVGSGFVSTQRDIDEFDRQQAANQAKMEAHLRSVVRFSGKASS